MHDDDRASVLKQVIVSIIVGIIPAVGWEYLTCSWFDGKLTLTARPLVAWGLNALGQVLPIAPWGEPLLGSDYGLRQVGTATICVRGGDLGGWYESTEEWMAELAALRDYAETRAAEKNGGGAT